MEIIHFWKIHIKAAITCLDIKIIKSVNRSTFALSLKTYQLL